MAPSKCVVILITSTICLEDLTNEVQLPSATFREHALARPPDVLFAMADEPTHANPGNTRLKSSLDRSLGWLTELLDEAEVGLQPGLRQSPG